MSTAGEAVQWASSFLYDAFEKTSHTFRAADHSERRAIVRSNVETLLLAATGWSRTRLLVSSADALPADSLVRFRAAVQRRATGEPLQYILGEAWFYGRPFTVRPGCLIPRPETEVLAELATTWTNQHAPHAKVVDIGTGSGCLAVTLALECPGTSVSAVDLSDDALSIARENAAALGARVDFAREDGIAWLRDRSGGTGDAGDDGRVNVLVSNPPYIPSEEVDVLDTEVVSWEPRLALDGGDDGLDIYRELRDVSARAFADGPAALFLEVGAGQADDVCRLFIERCGDLWPGWTFGIKPDLRGIGRVVWGERR